MAVVHFPSGWTEHTGGIEEIAIDAPRVEGAVNQIVPAARAKISVRIAPGDAPDQAIARLTRHLESVVPWGAELHVEPGLRLPAVEVEPTGVAFTLAEEALRAVPRSYVEASTALGAARWQTTLRVVLPAASPGIAAGVALGLGRAVGETMIVLMASGNAAIVSGSFADSARTIAATIAAELAEVVFGGSHYTVLFFLGTLLFLVTFGINTVGDWAIRRMKRRLGSTT